MAQLSQTQIRDVNAEVLEHMMNPQNYGSIEPKDASGIGMGLDTTTGEFAMMYLIIDKDDIINDVKFACNACQDTVVAGSLFTSMIKGASLEYAIGAAKKLAIKIQDAPPKQQACSGMVIKGFEAAMQNKNDKENGSQEEMAKLALDTSCEGSESKEGQI